MMLKIRENAPFYTNFRCKSKHGDHFMFARTTSCVYPSIIRFTEIMLVFYLRCYYEIQTLSNAFLIVRVKAALAKRIQCNSSTTLFKRTKTSI